MHTILPVSPIPKGRTRRTYSPSFREQLIEQSRQVGVSCAAVAISHGINPNVLRRWIKEADKVGVIQLEASNPMTVEIQSGFVPVPMRRTTAQPAVAAQTGVRIEILRDGTTVSVMWPAADLQGSAAWVREILR